MTQAEGSAPAPAPPSGGDAGSSADPSPPPGDGRPGGGDGGKGPEPSDANTAAGEAGQPAEEQAPSQHLGSRSVQYVTNVWKVEHQHVGVQQTGTVQGGMAMGLGASTTVTTQDRADRTGPVRGRIRPGDLARIRAVHVAAPASKHAQAALRRHHIAILHGRACWGKATTAVHLLDGLHPGEVYVVDPTANLGGLDVGALDPHSGYLVERLNPEAAAALSAETLLRLSERLAEQDCHLAVTVDGLTPLRRRTLGDALVSCDELPDADQVLRRTLAWQLGGDATPVERLVGQAWVREELVARPAPARVAALAMLLAGMEQGRISPGQAAAARHELVTDQVTEWFETHPERRERSLMVALAVLNRGSYQEVADAAERLDALLESPVNSRPGDPPAVNQANDPVGSEADEQAHEPWRRRKGVHWHLSSPRDRRVQDCYARLTLGSEPTTIGDVPAEVVQLDDDGLQPAVLDHVWREHDVVRSTLVSWFRELGAHPSLTVSSRAAAAVGSLLQRDFRYLHDQLLREWAEAEDRDVRWSAAVALDVLAAVSPEDEQRVQRLLHHWITANPASPQAWTAVAAYGFEVGRRCTDAALDDLLVVIRQHVGARWITGCTMANLCEAGQAAPVLDRLITWSTQRREELLRGRALRVFLHAAATELIGTGLPADGRSDSPDGLRPDPPSGTPVLLWVAAPEAQLRERLATLWSGALDHPPIEGWAGDVLRRWVDRVGEEPVLEPLLDSLLDELRQSRRIGPIVARLLSDWANDPFRPSRTAAQRLDVGPSHMAAIRR